MVLTKKNFQILNVDKMNNIKSFQPDGALGLGLLDNFYNNDLKKMDI